LLLLAAADPVGAGECRALVVAGDPGQEAIWSTTFPRWADAWAALLAERGVTAAHLRVLRSPDRSGSATPAAAIPAENLASRAMVLKALADIARDSTAADQVVVVLIGHGYQSEGTSKLCLPGDDLSDRDLAQALTPLAAKQVVVLDLAPDSVGVAKLVTGPGRAIVLANVKQSTPYFCEFLLLALKPRNVNLLDAFNAASLDTIHWYQNQFGKKDKVEITVNGRAYQEIFQKVYPDKIMIRGLDDPQAAVNDIWQESAYEGRRVPVEVAGLEDDGDGVPSTVFEVSKEPKPLTGETKDGAFSRGVIIGRP
jgi:hypothetical protein